MTAPAPASARLLAALPKAHLHLHFTGSMRPGTVLELAATSGVRLPDVLVDALSTGHVPQLSAVDERGWFRFQRLYDTARRVLATEAAIRRLIHEAVADDAAEGSGWLELQVDPSGYAGLFGGISTFTELVLDAAREASVATGVGVGIMIAANRTRHPLEARTLARLAARYADDGVVAFGLSNDERRGTIDDFAAAFRIADRGGLLLAPHAGELRGPDSVRAALALGAARLGHGVRSAEDAEVLATVVERGVALEVCPASNVSLGVYPDAAHVPLRHLVDAGATVALGADDPLLFGSRLLAQYESARHVHRFSDPELADLARGSITASRAPSDLAARLLAGVDDWLNGPGPVTD